MAKKQRSLKTQLNYAVSESKKTGQSKQADKYNPNIDTKNFIYSDESADAYRDTITNFVNYMKEAHPEIKYVRDLTVDHFNGWIAAREKDWRNKTYDNMVSRVGKLERMLNRTYHLELDLTTSLKHRPIDRMDKTQIRNLAMSRDDLNKLKCELGKSKSPNVLRAIEITSRTGLRVNEVSHLRFDHIDLDKGCIHAVEGTKNGKKRDVPIREKDVEFFWNLKYNVKQKSPYVCGGILPDSINKAIRRAMEKTGLNRKYINTTEHAVRKLYATELFQEELERLHDERRVWEVVQQELGHGNRFRENLFRTYIKI